jgi:hypothetical protein
MTPRGPRPGRRQQPSGPPRPPDASGAPAEATNPHAGRPEADPEGFVCLPVDLLRELADTRRTGWRWRRIQDRALPEEETNG